MSTMTATPYYAHITDTAIPRVTVGYADRTGIPQRVGPLAPTDDGEWGLHVPTTMTVLTPDALRKIADRIEAWERNEEGQ